MMYLVWRVAVSILHPAQTIIVLPDDIPWRVPHEGLPDCVAEAVLAGGEDQDGAYLVLIEVVPRADECSAQLRDRPPLRGCIPGVVVQQRSGLRPVPSGPRLPGRFRAPGGRDAAL